MISINSTNLENLTALAAADGVTVNSLNNYKHEITVHKVILMYNSNGQLPRLTLPCLTYSQMNFTNISSFDQIKETGILAGNNKKIFLFTDEHLQHDNFGIMNIKNILKNNREVVIETSRKRFYGKPNDYRFRLDDEVFILDLFVDAVCK